MAKRESSNPEFKKSKPMEVATVARLADDLVFIPSDNERTCKSEFWIKWQDGPVRSDDKITAAAVSQVLGRTTVSASWSKPGFKEWFLNKDEFRISAERYCMEAIDVTRQIMYSAEKDADKLKAARTMMELSNKFVQKKAEVVVADASVQKMDISDLKEFIKQNEDYLKSVLLESSNED